MYGCDVRRCPAVVQADFCKHGSLAVPDGDAVVGVINKLMARCPWDLVVLSQDYHPKGAWSWQWLLIFPI